MVNAPSVFELLRLDSCMPYVLWMTYVWSAMVYLLFLMVSIVGNVL